MTAGKRITDRLYVGFEQSLGAAESILKLEYDLTQRMLVRAQTGDRQYQCGRRVLPL